MSRETLNLCPNRDAHAIEATLEWEDLEVAAKARQWIEDMKARMNAKEKCDGC